MSTLQILPIEDSLYQKLTMNLTIGEDSRRVMMELRYLEKTDRWYQSLMDVQTKEPYMLNVPLLSSKPDSLNNLWAPFSHKGVGIFACYPKSDNVSTENPSKDNLKDFLLLWSDGNAE